jgi:hypothetical protein
VTEVEMTPAGTSIFAFVYQPAEQSPVAALTTCVMVVDATAVEGEYSSGPNVARPINAGMVNTPARPDTASAREFLLPVNAVRSLGRGILMRELSCASSRTTRVVMPCTVTVTSKSAAAR